MLFRAALSYQNFYSLLTTCFCNTQLLKDVQKNYPSENFWSLLSLSTGSSEHLIQRDSITDDIRSHTIFSEFGKFSSSYILVKFKVVLSALLNNQ